MDNRIRKHPVCDFRFIICNCLNVILVHYPWTLLALCDYVCIITFLIKKLEILNYFIFNIQSKQTLYYILVKA